MTLDDFQKAWKAEAASMQVSFDTELLAEKVKQSQSSFRGLILRRDIREVGISLVMIPIWIAMGITLSLPWTWYLTIPALLWMAGFMLVDRVRHPQNLTRAGEPLIVYVQESLNQVEHQIWLLRNVFWWGLLPFTISIMLFFLQVGWDSLGRWWGSAIIAGLGGSFLFYVYRWIYRLNQTAVRDLLEPRRDNLRNLLNSLETGCNAEDSEELQNFALYWTPDQASDPLNVNAVSWADNWNRIIPSWREVAIILAPTLVGAFCGWRFAIPDIGTLHFGPVFFQSVVTAVIPFEIAFFTLWFRSNKRQQNKPLPSDGTTRLKAPAQFILTVIIVMAILAILALVAFGLDQHSRRASKQATLLPLTKVIR